MNKNYYHLGWILADIINTVIPPWYLSPFFIGHALLQGFCWYIEYPCNKNTDKMEMWLFGCAVACVAFRLVATTV